MALYYPPITPRSPIFANSNYAIPNTPVSAGGTGTITEEFLATNYLQFPGAQGVENFGFKELQLTSTNLGETATLYINPATGPDVILETSQTTGSLTIQTPATTLNTMILSPSTGITFGDLTTQNTAFIEANYAQLNTNNTFLSPYINTFQGSNSTTTTTAPLQFSNITSGEYGSLFVDPSSSNDLTIYSNQTNGGLTIRNPSASFTLNPYTITSGIIGARSLNPIDMNGNGLYGLSNLYYNGNATTALMNLSSGTIGFNNNNLSQIGTVYIGDNSGTNYSTINQSGFNLSLVNNTPYSGGGTNNINFNLKNSTNTLVNPLTIYPTSILIGTQLDLNTNTLYNASLNSNCVATTQGLGNSSTAIATTAFVQNAIDALPVVSGYAELNTATLQTFTGPITFSGTTKATTQVVGTNDTTLATTEFVLANQGTPSSNYAQLTQTSGASQTFTTPINFSSTLQSNSVTVATVNNLPYITQTYLIPYVNTTLNPALGSINGTTGSPYQETSQLSSSTSARTSFFSNPVYINFGAISGLASYTPILQLQFNNPNDTTSSNPVKPWPNFPPPAGYYWVFVNTGTITQSWPVFFSQEGIYSIITFYCFSNMGANTTGYYDFSSIGLIPA